MKKETKLIKVPKIIRKDKSSFFIEDKDVILNSIKVYAYDISQDKEVEVCVKINIKPKCRIEVNISGMILDCCDYFILKYETVREATVLTIEAKDYINLEHDSKGNYNFYMEKALEVDV